MRNASKSAHCWCRRISPRPMPATSTAKARPSRPISESETRRLDSPQQMRPQAGDADDDEIDRDDEIEDARDQQNQNTRDQRDQAEALTGSNAWRSPDYPLDKR